METLFVYVMSTDTATNCVQITLIHHHHSVANRLGIPRKKGNLKHHKKFVGDIGQIQFSDNEYFLELVRCGLNHLIHVL